jgi:hypothetical protein
VHRTGVYFVGVGLKGHTLERFPDIKKKKIKKKKKIFFMSILIMWQLMDFDARVFC